MERFRIERTGKSAISFEGELIAEVDGKWVSGKDQNRWHDIALYKTKGGNYVCHVEYVTQWQGEVGYSEAESVKPEAVEGFFRGYDPASHVQGFPGAPQYAERQANLIKWVKDRYDAQVSELLAKCPEADEVVE